MVGGRWITLGILAAVFAIWGYLFFVPPPTLAKSFADGTYENPCCGSLTLRGGQMSVAGQTISYVVQKDKGGPYVLPSVYVGILDGDKFDIGRSRYPDKLRLYDHVHPWSDNRARPWSIEVSGEHVAIEFYRRS